MIYWDKVTVSAEGSPAKKRWKESTCNMQDFLENAHPSRKRGQHKVTETRSGEMIRVHNQQLTGAMMLAKSFDNMSFLWTLKHQLLILQNTNSYIVYCHLTFMTGAWGLLQGKNLLWKTQFCLVLWHSHIFRDHRYCHKMTSSWHHRKMSVQNSVQQNNAVHIINAVSVFWIGSHMNQFVQFIKRICSAEKSDSPLWINLFRLFMSKNDSQIYISPL